MSITQILGEKTIYGWTQVRSNGVYIMDKSKPPHEKPPPEKLKALKSLPVEILTSLTKEEVNVFLFDELWTDSLHEKLKEYLV